MSETDQKPSTLTQSDQKSQPQSQTASKQLQTLTPNIQPPVDLHCPANYSDIDIQALEVNKAESLPHIDSCFNYHHDLLQYPPNFDTEADTVRWISLTSYAKNKAKNEIVYENFDVEKLKNLDFSVGYLNAVALLAQKGQFLERNFEELEENDQNGLGELRACKINLNIGGIWTEYIIDDYVPVMMKSEGKNSEGNSEEIEFLYTEPSEDGIWLPLLEKAYAKAHGGYKKLKGSVYEEAVKDLSGVPCLSFELGGEKDVSEREINGDKSLEFWGAKEDDEVKNKLWEKMENCLEKDYLVSVCGDDCGESGFLKGVNYRVSAVEGGERKMVELINPSLDNSGICLEQAKDSENKGGIWISFNDLLKTFNRLNICPTNLQNHYNSVHIPLISENYIQSILKIEIQDPGPYTISVDQKGKNLYPPDTFQYNKCSLTLGKLLEGEIEYIGHCITDKRRNTVLDMEFLEDGSYVALIDIQVNKVNYVYESDFEGDLSHWRDITLNVYGGEYSRLDSLAMDPNRQMMYDYFLHRIWKDYAKKHKEEQEHLSKKMQVKMFPCADDSEKEPEDIEIMLQIFELPHLSIYKLSNSSENHIQVGCILKNKLPKNIECYGPYEVNNEDPWAVVNSNSEDVLIFKHNDRTEEVPFIEVNENFEIIESKSPNPEEYYGEDPYEFMVKLYTVQPGKTYPAVFFPVEENGYLTHNRDFQEMKQRVRQLQEFDGMDASRVEYESPEREEFEGSAGGAPAKDAGKDVKVVGAGGDGVESTKNESLGEKAVNVKKRGDLGKSVFEDGGEKDGDVEASGGDEGGDQKKGTDGDEDGAADENKESPKIESDGMKDGEADEVKPKEGGQNNELDPQKDNDESGANDGNVENEWPKENAESVKNDGKVEPEDQKVEKESADKPETSQAQSKKQDEPPNQEETKIDQKTKEEQPNQESEKEDQEELKPESDIKNEADGNNGENENVGKDDEKNVQKSVAEDGKDDDDAEEPEKSHNEKYDAKAGDGIDGNGGDAGSRKEDKTPEESQSKACPSETNKDGETKEEPSESNKPNEQENQAENQETEDPKHGSKKDIDLKVDTIDNNEENKAAGKEANSDPKDNEDSLVPGEKSTPLGETSKSNKPNEESTKVEQDDKEHDDGHKTPINEKDLKWEDLAKKSGMIDPSEASEPSELAEPNKDEKKESPNDEGNQGNSDNLKPNKKNPEENQKSLKKGANTISFGQDNEGDVTPPNTGKKKHARPAEVPSSQKSSNKKVNPFKMPYDGNPIYQRKILFPTPRVPQYPKVRQPRPLTPIIRTSFRPPFPGKQLIHVETTAPLPQHQVRDLHLNTVNPYGFPLQPPPTMQRVVSRSRTRTRTRSRNPSRKTRSPSASRNSHNPNSRSNSPMFSKLPRNSAHPSLVANQTILKFSPQKKPLTRVNRTPVKIRTLKIQNRPLSPAQPKNHYRVAAPQPQLLQPEPNTFTRVISSSSRSPSPQKPQYSKGPMFSRNSTRYLQNNTPLYIAGPLYIGQNSNNPSQSALPNSRNISPRQSRRAIKNSGSVRYLGMEYKSVVSNSPDLSSIRFQNYQAAGGQPKGNQTMFRPNRYAASPKKPREVRRAVNFNRGRVEEGRVIRIEGRGKGGAGLVRGGGMSRPNLLVEPDNYGSGRKRRLVHVSSKVNVRWRR